MGPMEWIQDGQADQPASRWTDDKKKEGGNLWFKTARNMDALKKYIEF